ncbi:MAG: Zn-dependent hydrolase, partial [Candidatus Kapaibacterium sp.]
MPETEVKNEKIEELNARIGAYAAVDLQVDLSHLTERERTLISKLIEAGKIIDKIFWYQASHDAIAVRDSLAAINSDEAKKYLEFVMLNYGPYDDLSDKARFVGDGPDRRPLGGGFYPSDMTKEEFEEFVKANPNLEAAMKNDYTIITRDNGVLKAVPYSIYYK